MSDELHPRALDRLAAFEAPVRRPAVPRGSAGLQMAASILLPGVPSMRRHPLLGLFLLLVGVLAPFVLGAWAFANRDDLVGFALDPRFLTAVVGIATALVVVRLLAVAEVAVAFRRAPWIGLRTALATVVVAALGVPVAWVGLRANEARGVVGDVFAGGGGPSLFLPGSADPDALTNILLLGGDAGPGRWGLRTDTMIVVSIDEHSDRSALISVPRNLTRLRFPPGTPLAGIFPDGFDDLANAVFPYVSTRPELMAHYGRDGLQGEAVALAEGIGYSLDIEIDDYALVNMQGFLEVIDAVGGVTLDLDAAVPMPGTIPGGKHPLPDSIGPGRVEMDGTLAIGYVRSRSADSDYQRMGRQRQLLAALGSQISPRDALSGFSSVTGLIGDSVRTSLSSREFSRLLDRLGDSSSIVESVGLVPPLVTPGSPDYDRIREIVRAVEQAVLTGVPSGYGG